MTGRDPVKVKSISKDKGPSQMAKMIVATCRECVLVREALEPEGVSSEKVSLSSFSEEMKLIKVGLRLHPEIPLDMLVPLKHHQNRATH